MPQRAGKTTMRKLMTGVTLGAVAGLLLIFAIPSYNHGEASVAGSKARDFSFEMNGKQMQLTDMRGKVVVVNFWASWCPPCVDETPSLIALQKEIAPKGATVLGISSDYDEQSYAHFVQTSGIDFPTYFDGARTISAEYGTYVYPETYIIGRDGRIARKLVGEQDWMSPEMTAYFTSLLQNN